MGKRRIQALDQVAIGGFWIATSLSAEPTEPAVAGSDVTNLIAQNEIEHCYRLPIPDLPQLLLNHGGSNSLDKSA
jgi:hypothetical protein